MSLLDKLYSQFRYCLHCGTPLEHRTNNSGHRQHFCPACGAVFAPRAIPTVACLVLNEDNQLLLVKRSFEPKAGWWALPGGYMETDLTPEQNAVAELHEETGLMGEIDHFIGWHYNESEIYYRTLSLGFRLRVSGGVLQAGDDALEAGWYALAALPPIAFDSHRKFIRMETGLLLPAHG